MKQLGLWLGVSALVLVSWAEPALADTTTQSVVLNSCGGMNYPVGQARADTQTTTGLKCVNATVSASVTGFRPTSTGTSISVTTDGVTGTLPSGAEVVASNAGSTNTAYCKLGASATTSDQPIPPGGWFGFAISADTQLTCITSTSTTTVNMVGGSGLPTGSGGGGSGGGGGNVTNAGTFAVQNTAATPAGSAIMGKVSQVDSGGTDATDTTNHADRVNCVVGCSGGAFNNNADAVATSSTNGQAAAWLYGYNGATWDRIRDDTNKYLFVDIGAVPASAFADGALVTEGLKADAQCAGASTPCSINARLADIEANTANTGPVTVGGQGPTGTPVPVLIEPSNSASLGVTPAATSVAASSVVVCSGPCNIWSFDGTTAATAGYFMLFNATSAPVDGTVTPAACVGSIAATSPMTPQRFNPPLRMTTGATLVFSSTGCYSKTASATAFMTATASQ